MDANALKAAKDRLSPNLLRVPGVSGVGIAGGKLHMYLADDSETARNAVRDVVQAEAPKPIWPSRSPAGSADRTSSAHPTARLFHRPRATRRGAALSAPERMAFRKSP